MKFLFFILFTHSFAHAYLSYGNGTDNCNFTSTQTLTKAVWNCIDLDIPNGVVITFNSSVTDAVQFRVQGNVTIDGTINISANGTTPGPGGSASGDCPVGGSCNLQNGSGDTTGRGKGGGAASGDADGGSGSGAGLLVAGGGGNAGPNTFGGTVGTAGTAGSAFTTTAAIRGSILSAPGGGAGGSAFQAGLGDGDAGDGGAGAGTLIIVSKGDITLSATASLIGIGGAGSAGSDTGGGLTGGDGGGGAGGIFYLVTDSTLSSSGATITYTGGVSTAGGGAVGGSGADGFLVVDTPDGTFTGSFSSAPSNTGTTPVGILDPGIQVTISSDITPTCTYKEMPEFEYLNLGLSFFIGFCLISLFSLISHKLRPVFVHI